MKPTLARLRAHSSCVRCGGAGVSWVSWPQGKGASPTPAPGAFPFEPQRCFSPIVSPERSQQSCLLPGRAASSLGEQVRGKRQMLFRRKSSKMCF